MAAIQEKIKDGKLISCKFKACLGRCENGKQIFRCMTWYPPDNLTLAKARKSTQMAADTWESEIKRIYLQEQGAVSNMASYPFDRFVNEVWIPQCLRDGTHRPKSIDFYMGLLRLALLHFQNIPLNEITGIKVNEYLVWLRSGYRTARGKPLAEKTVKHHYGLLLLIFNYAERQDILVSNPMKKIDAPKVSKKPVDALSPNETTAFLSALSTCSLDFRCMLQVLITTGVRRGECLGFQWRDIDYNEKTIHVERSVTYTSESGIIVDAPKTPKSIRTIPIMESTISLLNELRQQIKSKYPNSTLDYAYLFGSPTDSFVPRDPNAVTKRLKRFIKATGLPDVSPHDLRHTCASLLLSSGADIKSVQEILGHTDASTTLNFYVKSDMNQMRTATDKFASAFNL